MIKHEDWCVCCPPEMGCLGRGCSNRNVAVFICDKCKEEVNYDDIKDIDGSHICRECYMEKCEEEFDNFNDVSDNDYY